MIIANETSSSSSNSPISDEANDNDRNAFTIPRYMTSLARHVRQLTDDAISYSISSTIFENTSPYVKGAKHCRLCLTERVRILKNSLEPENIPKRRFSGHV